MTMRTLVMALITLGFTAACVPPPGQIEIRSVEVVEGSSISASGHSNFTTGTCIQLYLFVDRTPVPWWPVEQCAEIEEDGTWTMRIPLARGAAPEQLNPGASYVLVAWLRGNPRTVSRPFPFDLAGPPPGVETTK